jgi:hypothetical protein
MLLCVQGCTCKAVHSVAEDQQKAVTRSRRLLPEHNGGAGRGGPTRRRVGGAPAHAAAAGARSTHAPDPREMEFTYPLAVGTLVSLYCVSRRCGALDGTPSSPHSTCVSSNPMKSDIRVEARRATTPREAVWWCTVVTYRCRPTPHGRAPGRRSLMSWLMRRTSCRSRRGAASRRCCCCVSTRVWCRAACVTPSPPDKECAWGGSNAGERGGWCIDRPTTGWILCWW